MIPSDQRPPFDDQDKAIVERYLAARGLIAFDPFADAPASRDLIFTTSLGAACWMMEQSFGTRTAAGRLFRGYPVFVETASPNAFAIDVDGLNICGVHIGLVASLYEISHFVFAQAALFPEIGDPSVERSPSLSDGTTLSFIMADRFRADPAAPTSGPVGAELLPQDAQRNLAAHFLMQLMLRFAWLHEIYHALNGHCGLMAVRSRGTALNDMPDAEPASIIETEQKDIDPPWQSTLHSMEFDADRTALWVMMRMQEIGEEPIVGLAALPRSIRLKLVLFAGFMMTFLFEQAAKRDMRAKETSHPIPYHRLHNLVRTFGSNVPNEGGETRAAFDDVLNEMTRLRERVPNLFSAGQLMADLREDVLQATFDQVEMALEVARELFRPFAFSL